MTTTLPINDSIVPAHVTRSYLNGYDPAMLQKIETLYQKIKFDAVSRITSEPKPGASVFVLVAGTQGVGKSAMVKKLLDARPEEQFVECDVDSILSVMPEVVTAISDTNTRVHEDFHIAGEMYDSRQHRSRLESVVSHLRPAAKYISDRLMSECVAEGYNVIVETNAKAKNIADFLNSVKKTGVVLEGHICEAPLSVKKSGARSKQHGFSYPEEILVSEQEAFRKNMPAIAQACTNKLTIWWRQSANAPLEMAALSHGAKDYSLDPVGKAGFEAHFADIGGLTIASLMGQRKVWVPTSEKESAPKAAMA